MAKDLIATDIVAARLDGVMFNQIGLSTKHEAQFFLHLRHVEKRSARIRMEADQYVDIAVGAKVFSQGGAK